MEESSFSDAKFSEKLREPTGDALFKTHGLHLVQKILNLCAYSD